jgi:hypothetical protein
MKQRQALTLPSQPEQDVTESELLYVVLTVAEALLNPGQFYSTAVYALVDSSVASTCGVGCRSAHDTCEELKTGTKGEAGQILPETQPWSF